jgi:predicted CXXCH cytochrome family protein
VLRTLAIGASALAGVALVSALFLAGLAAKERDDRFCVSCHLHEAKFTRFRAAAPVDLAGAHHAKKAVRCIDCHGGADPVMRGRVWTVAGVDTLRFLAGLYGEPERMRLPLRPAECRQCHTPILTRAPAGEEEGGGGAQTYHAIRDHDAVRIACARCHLSHTTDSEARLQFISRARVQPICRECHSQFGGSSSRAASARAVDEPAARRGPSQSPSPRMSPAGR